LLYISNENIQIWAKVSPDIVDDVDGVIDLRKAQKVKTKMENLNI
jgi:hypothetical protein